MEVGIRISLAEVRHVEQLFELNRAGVIDIDHITYIAADQCYLVELDGLRAEYVMEIILDGLDGRSFESFPEWQRRRLDQLSLPLN